LRGLTCVFSIFIKLQCLWIADCPVLEFFIED
jgi:hypothetical protein